MASIPTGTVRTPTVSTKTVHPQVDLRTELDNLKGMYTKQISEMYNTFNLILLGELGVGKTSLLKTARKPVLVHSFDPGGCKLNDFRPLIESGEVLVDPTYELENYKEPTAFAAWEKEFDRLRRIGLFSKIGTYCIDSYTTWLQAAVNELAKRRGRADSILQIQDWQVLGKLTINMVKLATALPCDFILTGHLDLTKEEVSGRMIARFKSIPSLQVDVPLLFDEIYCMQAEETRDGVVRRLLTQPTGRYVARTRIGSGLFETYEKPDIGYLLKKCGLVK